ncbi:MAG: hypothetical protein R2725_11805 [Solirubrobacterales bacterium]
MATEQEWGEDTVALGREAAPNPSREPEEERRPCRGWRVSRAGLLGAVMLIVGALAIVSVLGGRSDSTPARPGVTPGAQAKRPVKSRAHKRRREARATGASTSKRRPKGKLKRREHRSGAAGQGHERSGRGQTVEGEAAEPLLAPEAGAEGLVEEASPATPAAPTPTPPGVEFGL